MPDLKGTKTHDNLKEAFAGESQANRRYLYFAQKADVEGYPDVAASVRLEVNHANYKASTELSAAAHAELAVDLREGG